MGLFGNQINKSKGRWFLDAFTKTRGKRKKKKRRRKDALELSAAVGPLAVVRTMDAVCVALDGTRIFLGR